MLPLINGFARIDVKLASPLAFALHVGFFLHTITPTNKYYNRIDLIGILEIAVKENDTAVTFIKQLNSKLILNTY